MSKNLEAISVHILGAIRKDPEQLGELAGVLVERTRKALISTTTDTEERIDKTPADSIEVYARGEVKENNTLPSAEGLTAPLIIASTGVDMTQYEKASQPVINAENLAPEIWKELQNLKNIMEEYPNAQVMCIEAHQTRKGFKSIPGTAKEGMIMATGKGAETILEERVQIESLKDWEDFEKDSFEAPEKYYGKIISIRSNEVSSAAFDVPDEHLGGHGIHKFLVFDNGEIVKTVQTRILGREKYGDGLVALLNVLHSSPEEFKNGVTHIRQYVESGVLEIAG